MVVGGSGRLSSTTPPWLLFHPFHGEPPEPTGVRTPPLRLPGSIPFRWEVVPGKPKEEPGTFGPGPNSCPSSPLELPPRLAAAMMEKASSAIDSTGRSPDFKDQISSYISGCHALPKLMNRSSRDRWGRRIKNNEWMFWLYFGRKKGKVDMVLGKLEEICPSASSTSSSDLQTSPSSGKVHHEEETREEEKTAAKVTRFTRSRSVGVGQCTHASSRFWASIYGSLKKVVP